MATNVNKDTMELKEEKPEFLVKLLIHLNNSFNTIDKLLELKSKEELEKQNQSVPNDKWQFIKATINQTNDKNEFFHSLYKRAERIENLKQYLHVVDNFSGSNMNVEEFIIQILTVMKKFTIADRQMFIQLINKQKIIGEAKGMLDGIQIKNENEFFETLRVLFGDANEIISARLERNRCIQGRDSVMMYSLKFLQSQIDIMNAINCDPILTISKKKSRLLDERKGILNSYISGLKYKIKILLSLKAFEQDNLFDAINMALKVERKLI